MDRKTWQVAGALFVIVPVLWSALGSAIGLYDRWVEVQARLNALERYRCAMGGRPPETIDWKRSMTECRETWGTR